jgi:hypothetical protein
MRSSDQEDAPNETTLHGGVVFRNAQGTASGVDTQSLDQGVDPSARFRQVLRMRY